MRAAGRRARALLGVALLLGGCGGAPPREAPAPVAPAIRLDGMDGDVWAFRRRVVGEAGAGCARVEIRAGRHTVEAIRDGERFRATVPLAPGPNEVVALCRAANGRVAVRSAPRRWRVPLEARPTARIRISLVDAGLRLDAGASTVSEASGEPIVRRTWRARPSNPEPLATVDGRPLAAGVDGDDLLLRPPAADGKYYVSVEVTDAAGARDRSENYFVVRDGAPTLPDLERAHPAWVDTAVVYGVVPPFFGPRGLEDVRARLDDLRALGVDTLWLSPILGSTPDDFGYAVTDYFGIREAYGSEAALKRLVDDAHRRGMRVIMDFVPNHSAAAHRYFRHAETHGRRSPYFGYYERDPEGQPTWYFGWDHLPNLDYDHPEVRRWMREAFAYWIREFDIDGFRVDVTWGVQRRAPEFWPALRAELKRIKPDILLLAEATARDGTLFRSGFDAAYDWTWKLGEWAWADAFARRPPDLDALRAAITGDGGFSPDAVVFRFLNNNDTGHRFLTRHGPGLQAAAAAMLFTLPGIPSLYTGDEVGAEYEPYQRLEPLDFTPRPAIRAVFERLIALRRAEPLLRTRALTLLPVTPDDRVLAYLRPDPAGDAPPLLVTVNFSDAPVRARVRLPAPFDDALAGGPLRDLLGGGHAAPARAGAVTTDLPPYGARVLTRRSTSSARPP